MYWRYYMYSLQNVQSETCHIQKRAVYLDSEKESLRYGIMVCYMMFFSKWLSKICHPLFQIQERKKRQKFVWLSQTRTILMTLDSTQDWWTRYLRSVCFYGLSEDCIYCYTVVRSSDIEHLHTQKNDTTCHRNTIWRRSKHCCISISLMQ